MQVSNGISPASGGARGAFRPQRVSAYPVWLPIAVTLLIRLPLPGDDDPKEIVRRAMLLNSEESKIQKEYTCTERVEERKRDSSGAVLSVDSKNWDITQLEGRQFRRLIQHNDKPLTPKEEQQEQARQKLSLIHISS